MPIPQDFRFAAVHAGLKSDAALEDMALVVSDRDAVCAGVFTQNRFCGAPVQMARERLPGRGFRAVVVNTRVANACTGDEGVADAKTMAALAARAVGAAEDKALAMSTGVIGRQLPMDKIEAGISALAEKLDASDEALHAAARGMMTTDTVPKFASREAKLSSGRTVTLAGLCKGSGMIAPNMATMLAVLTTDAALDVDDAQALLKRVADESFNCVSVDGDTSTSDMLLLLANGAAVETALNGADLRCFEAELLAICTELAVMIATDGEGATHLVTITVDGCPDKESARKIAKSIAESPLVKTAIAGADPNWGRVLCAAGYAGVDFDPGKTSLKINGIPLFRDGAPLLFDAKTVSSSIRDNKETRIDLHLGQGPAATRFWTCDLTKDYIAINADYTT